MKNWKNYVIVVLCLGIGVMTFYAMRFKEKAEHPQLITESVKKQVQAEATILARKVDAHGIQSVTIAESENIVPSNKNDLIAISEGLRDTTAKALARVGVLEKQLENLMIINTTLVAANLNAKKVVADNGRPSYTYKDQFVDLSYTPPAGTDTISAGMFDFKYNADLNIVQYWKRKWLLGSKVSYIDINSNDPRTSVNGVKRLVFEQKQPTFGLRLQGSANYNPQTGSIGFGPAARFDVGRFSVQGNYTWYPESDRWRPSINANFDLIRF